MPTLVGDPSPVRKKERHNDRAGMRAAAIALATLLAALQCAEASCVVFAGAVLGSDVANSSAQAYIANGTQVHINVTGVTGFSGSMISFLSGNSTGDVAVSWAGARASGSPDLASAVYFDAAGTLVIAFAGTQVSTGSTRAAPLTALTAAAATTALVAMRSASAPLVACGLLSSAAWLAHAVCTLTLHLNVTLPAHLGVTRIPMTPPGSFYYTVGPASTHSPTSRPTDPYAGG